MNITIISATNRANSNTLKVVNNYAQLMVKQGVNPKILSLEALPDDVSFSDLYDKRSEAFKQLLNEFIVPTQKFVVVAPEYNGSFPGILKVFLDAIPPEINRDKKVALIGVSNGRGGNLRGMDHLTGIFNHLGLHVHPNKIPISSISSMLDEHGIITDEKTIIALKKHISDIINW